MLRRLLAALLAVSIAVPLPAVAGLGSCSMDEPVLAATACNCCDSPTLPSSPCGSATGCGCSLQADTGSSTPLPAAASVVKVPSATEVTLAPTAPPGPRRELRPLGPAAALPGAGRMTSRPMLCSWTI